MKKIVALLLAVMMLTATFGAFAMTAGTYEGEAQGLMGAIKVSVVVTEDAIVSVTVTEQSETPSIAGPALEQIPAAIVAANDPTVDTLTGATLTGTRIMNAVAEYLKQAAK